MDAQVARDEYTGKPLDEDLAAKAKAKELKYFMLRGVWRVVPRARAHGQRVVVA